MPEFQTSATQPGVQVFVGGSIFTGWESVRINRGLEKVSGGFELSVSDVSPWPIKPGDAVVVKMGTTAVVTGWVDKVETDFADDRHTFRVSGRDKAGDLVDCSVVGGNGQFSNQTVAQVARAVCKPFGIGVIVDADVGGTVPTFSIQPGDTAWSTIERAARARGVLVVSDGEGNIRLTAPKSTRSGAALVHGQNVIEATFTADDTERHSQYEVRGQSAGTDNIFGDSAAQVANGITVTDAAVTRYRPLNVIAEQSIDVATANLRAKWERAVRAARARRASVRVAGWTKNPAGDLWAINELVTVSLPLFELAGDMLIIEVSFEQSVEGGTYTVLEIGGPDSFAVEPNKKHKGDKNGGGVDALFSGKETADVE